MSAPETQCRGGHRSRGQSLVEFSLIVPVFLLILFGMMEYGFIFTHDLTLEYATREGARAGSALANGGGTLGCGTGQSPNWTQVDPQVIAAVERVLAVARVAGRGLAGDPDRHLQGQPDHRRQRPGHVQHVWSYSAGAGPIPTGRHQPP